MRRKEFLAPRVVRNLSRFGRDESGVATIFACFMIVMMVLVGGIAVDLMHNEMERTKVQATMDRAVLAAANLNQELDPEVVVRDYFATSNIAEYLTGVTVDQGLNYRNVNATGQVRTPTRFMHHLGVDTLPAWASATAEQAAPNIEISLVLDISGSMRFSERMDELRPAAAAFLNIVLHDDYIDDTSINLIPYAGQTNVGPFMFNRLGGLRYPDIALEQQNGGTPTGRYPNVSSCLELNAGDFGYVGLPNAGSYNQVAHFMNWDIAADVMDWGWCPQDNTAVRYASNNRAGLIDFVNNFRMHDGTGTHYAMKYALALLDPSSRPHFDAMYAAGLIPAEFAGRPAEYDDPAARKFIVLMTDGQITEQVRPKNVMHLKNPTVELAKRTGDRTQIASASQNVSRFYALCNAAKASTRNIVIYTIAFEAPSGAQTEMRNCASSPSHFYNVDDDDDLMEVFDSIARQIRQLSLLQ